MFGASASIVERSSDPADEIRFPTRLMDDVPFLEIRQKKRQFHGQHGLQ
jgi:hypothetical protein